MEADKVFSGRSEVDIEQLIEDCLTSGELSSNSYRYKDSAWYSQLKTLQLENYVHKSEGPKLGGNKKKLFSFVNLSKFIIYEY